MAIDISQLSAEDQAQLSAILGKLPGMAAATKKKRAKRPVVVEKIKYLTEAQTAALFKAIKSPRDTAIFRLGYHRGLRATEVGMIQLSDVNLRDCRIRFARLKGSIGGEYHLTSIEERSLRAWLKIRGEEPGPLFPSRQGTPISQQMLDVLMKKYSAAAGIPDELAHFHSLKHSCATHLLRRGEPREAVRDHMGHRSAASTDVYCKFTGQEARDRRLRDWH
jgi:integrase